MSSGALFPSLVSGSRSSTSKYLVEFRAGKMTLKGSTVTPDKRKGTVYIQQTDDSLIHFCWKDRTTGNVDDVSTCLYPTQYFSELYSHVLIPWCCNLLWMKLIYRVALCGFFFFWCVVNTAGLLAGFWFSCCSLISVRRCPIPHMSPWSLFCRIWSSSPMTVNLKGWTSAPLDECMYWNSRLAPKGFSSGCRWVKWICRYCTVNTGTNTLCDWSWDSIVQHSRTTCQIFTLFLTLLIN